MQAIYKYELSNQTKQTIYVDKNFTPLRVAYQGDVMCLWAAVDVDSKDGQEIEVNLLGTGWEFDKMGQDGIGHYLGTVQDDPFVWHLFYKVK